MIQSTSTSDVNATVHVLFLVEAWIYVPIRRLLVHYGKKLKFVRTSARRA